MKFILDENVPVSARKVLEDGGHTVELIIDHAARGATDPVVATVSETLDAVLVSFDSDYERIAPRLPDGARHRYRRLSRIWLRCSEYQPANGYRRLCPSSKQSMKLPEPAMMCG